MTTRLIALLPAWLRARRGARPGRPRRSVRGAAELSVLAVVTTLVTGVFFGSGISHTAVDIADGLTWISDGPSGEVIQVNPATGKPQLRLTVAAPGDDLSIAQYDGRLFVTNRTTGQLQSFDLSRVLRTAARRVTQGTVVDTLTRDGELYLVDREQSTIARLDPVTLDELGAVWTSDTGLADAALDGAGKVWALDDDGTLHTLEWSTDDLAFDETDTRTVDLSGPGSVLVAHDTGVTVFGPDEGVVQQIGTTHDLETDAPRLGGDLRAPERTPDDLVPVAAPQTGTVVLSTPDGVLEVDVAAIGCSDPGTPEVFEGQVYVPCLGAGKVIRLGRDGKRAAPDILTPGSKDPELVLDDGSLIVNAPGAPTGAVVSGGGAVSNLTRYDPSIPAIVPGTATDPPRGDVAQAVAAVLDQVKPDKKGKDPQDTVPGQSPTAAPVTLPPVTTTGLPGTGGIPTTGPGGGGDSVTGNRPPPVTSTPTSTPTSTATSTVGPGTPLFPSATPSSPAPSSTPTSAPTAAPTAAPTRLPTSAPSPQPTTVAPAPLTPAPSPTPTQAPPPTLDAPTGVTADAVSGTQVRVTWTHAGADQYVVSLDGGADVAQVPGGNRQATVTVTPGQSNRFTVTAVAGSQRATSAPSGAVTTSGLPGQPSNVTAEVTTANYKTYRIQVSWGATADNGSPITQYAVNVQTEQGVRNTTTDGAARTATVTFVCPDQSCTGDIVATVTATNANGAGDAASNSADGPPPPPPALPAGGGDHVSGQDVTWDGVSYEGSGTLHLTMAPPGDWAAFGGTCSYTISGDGLRNGGGAIACGATSLDENINLGIVRSQNGGQVTHSYSVSFSASNGTDSVTSATHNGTYQSGSLCSNCPIP